MKRGPYPSGYSFASRRITSLSLSPGPPMAASLSTQISSSQTARSPALGVGLGLDGHAADRERGADRLEGGGADGDADSAAQPSERMISR